MSTAWLVVDLSRSVLVASFSLVWRTHEEAIFIISERGDIRWKKSSPWYFREINGGKNDTRARSSVSWSHRVLFRQRAACSRVCSLSFGESLRSLVKRDIYVRQMPVRQIRGLSWRSRGGILGDAPWICGLRYPDTDAWHRRNSFNQPNDRLFNLRNELQTSGRTRVLRVNFCQNVQHSRHSIEERSRRTFGEYITSKIKIKIFEAIESKHSNVACQRWLVHFLRYICNKLLSPYPLNSLWLIKVPWKVA